MSKDVNPVFEQETFGSGNGDLRDPTPDRFIINDDPSVRERLTEEEWVEVRTHLVDFIEAVRELPLDDTEPGLEPDEAGGDYESMPAGINGADAGSVQSKTLNRMMDELLQEILKERPDRQAICGIVQEAVVLLETLGFPLLQEEAPSVPLETAGGITQWWRAESTFAEPFPTDPAPIVDQNLNLRDDDVSR